MNNFHEEKKIIQKIDLNIIGLINQNLSKFFE